jgi:preprotein translocase subunit YajC
MHVTVLQLAATLVAQQGPAPGGASGFVSMAVPLLIVGAVMYLMVIRPANKEREKHQELLTALKRGDEVLTQAGLIGKITDMTDTIVTLEVARNVKVRILRNTISKKYEEATKPEPDADKEKAS